MCEILSNRIIDENPHPRNALEKTSSQPLIRNYTQKTP